MCIGISDEIVIQKILGEEEEEEEKEEESEVTNLVKN